MTRLQRVPQFIWFLLLGWLFLWPVLFHPNFILLRPDSLSDLLLTHLPNAVYIRESLVRYHQVPLWNGQIMSGQPFAADPLSGLWYPPNLALLVLPLPFGFNLLFALHLAWAGYGLFRFLRAESASLHVSFFGGLAFAGTPKLIAHLGAGHVSLVFAVAWTPWLLLAARQAAHEGGIKRGALAGAALAMVFLADVRWTFYAGLLAGALWLCRSLWPVGCRPSARRGVQAASTAIVISLMLTAILSLPLVEFIRYSSRGALSLQDAAIYSLPLYPYLLGLIIPIPGVLHEWVTYIGIVPLALAAYGAIRHRATSPVRRSAQHCWHFARRRYSFCFGWATSKGWRCSEC